MSKISFLAFWSISGHFNPHLPFKFLIFYHSCLLTFYMAESFFADGCKCMTALLEYLNLLCDAREVKLLHANQKEQSFLIYLTHLIVLCVYPEKYTPLLV